MAHLEYGGRKKGEEPWKCCYPEEWGVSTPPEDVDLDEFDCRHKDGHVVLEGSDSSGLISVHIKAVETDCERLWWSGERTGLNEALRVLIQRINVHPFDRGLVDLGNGVQFVVR